jgi:hypothetical protein
MRRAWVLVALAAVGAFALAAASLGGIAAPTPTPVDLPGRAQPGSIPVDVELVIAVDISYSMDPDELALQRDGYAEAIVSREFLDALRGGMHGRVAVTYFEWAGVAEQRIVVRRHCSKAMDIRGSGA